MNYEDDEESLNNYYDKEEDSNGDKEKKTVKYYKNQPYDMAFNLNESNELNSSDNLEKEQNEEKKNNTDKFEKMNTKNKIEEEEEDDEDEEEEEKQEFNYKVTGEKREIDLKMPQSNIKPLPRFDIKEFQNINASSEIKDLMQIMTK
jgi:hypothetical protein